MVVTPFDGVRAVRMPPSQDRPNRITNELPAHLSHWQLPPDWQWGSEGVLMEHRHYQEVHDALGRSLALVSAPDPSHTAWLASEARHLAHRNHPAITTTYHYWEAHKGSRRGPGYLRRWISAETIGSRVRRTGPEPLPAVLRMLRAAGSMLADLHDAGTSHGDISPETLWTAPTGRIWILGWQWAVPRGDVPPGLSPDPRWTPWPPEWQATGWTPTAMSDQWQLAATCFLALAGELPPERNAPPIALIRPECPHVVAELVDRGLREDPETRFPTLSAMLRSLERAGAPRIIVTASGAAPEAGSDEERLRWATGDDYEVLGFLGRGSFGIVWRVRDLSLEREVALKMLHPQVAQDEIAVARFRREARLAAQLAHPAIIPIFDFDTKGDVSWYTMELAEGGSVADLVTRAGPRSFDEIAGQVDAVLSALSAAHGSGIMHRDLKPENLLIDRYRRWRVTDFGIARGEEEQGGGSGTPAFAAPEQLLGETQGPGVDCFAVAGIVAYALSGVLPFSGHDVQGVLAQQISGQFDYDNYPVPVALWLRRGLAPNVSDRFVDATEMQTAWRQVMRDMRREAKRGGRWWGRFWSGR